MSRPTAPIASHDSLHGRKPGTDVSIDVPLLQRLSSARIAELASELADEEVTPSEPALLELTARHPYGELGRLDVYMPGRWDTTTDLIFMDTIVQTGPYEWTGSAAYVAFHPAEPATYLVVAHFTGHEITMHLTGPWGENTAYTPTTDDAGAVVALWTGGETSFGIHCTDNNEYSLGFFESLQVFRLS